MSHVIIARVHSGILESLEMSRNQDKAISIINKLAWNTERDDFTVWKRDGPTWRNVYTRLPDNDCPKCYVHEDHCTCEVET